MTSMFVTIKNIELYTQFAQAFNKLCVDAELPMKTKLSIGKLRVQLMEKGKELEKAKADLQAKTDESGAVPDEDAKAFSELMNSAHDYPFNRLDVTMIAKNLSVVELEALSPIIKQ